MKTWLKKIISQHTINLFWHKPKALLANILYGFPGKRLTIIAVAGTKGKTSTAYYISHILDSLNISNALFSTAALKIKGVEQLNTLKLTTATPFFLQRFLRNAINRGCTHVILEVSSHALMQYRIWGVPLSYVLITNLAPDHLEFHATGEEYQETHKKLISKNLKALILNADDPHLDQFKKLPVPIHTFSAHSPLAAAIHEKKLPLIGSFNQMNVLSAVTLVKTLGNSEQSLLQTLDTIKAAPGRMEILETNKDFKVVIDYAHSPESLEAFFQAIKPIATGKIITVFGACGERDATMRPVMGKIIDRYSDMIVVTNDDPYSEDPDSIAEGLISGIHSKQLNLSFWKILDRKAAIKKAVMLAGKDDIVCALGKGAEQWQVFKNKKIPWDDRKVVREILRAQP